MTSKLHKQRVNMFQKHKGTYWRVNFRSKRHLNQLILAARDAGYNRFVWGFCQGHYTLTMYKDNDLGTYNHNCGIRVPTFTV